MRIRTLSIVRFTPEMNAFIPGPGRREIPGNDPHHIIRTNSVEHDRWPLGNAQRVYIQNFRLLPRRIPSRSNAIEIFDKYLDP